MESIFKSNKMRVNLGKGVFALSLGMLFFTCSKNRDFICTCTSNVTGKVHKVHELNLTKSDAESSCDNIMTDSTTCVLERN